MPPFNNKKLIILERVLLVDNFKFNPKYETKYIKIIGNQVANIALIKAIFNDSKFLKDKENNTKEKPIEKQKIKINLFKKSLVIINGIINPVIKNKTPNDMVKKFYYLRILTFIFPLTNFKLLTYS
ncbi:hypothetical protein Halha_1191 [Halobacteroides halobius DSM 5150]|uniref:Uncharacterized protein n=1 Tax=Halobacteroides halobius (strain ATCC 35273 / DSM 5150 / MD-1) TaxID=748449 RepID=L0K9T7_HALHC|nr:hypothetical protein [Halobacteroides halobius]AGB41139.1 hypothetical protein Halha_1191 [Halobacteroides halobius DSM 5150]